MGDEGNNLYFASFYSVGDKLPKKAVCRETKKLEPMKEHPALGQSSSFGSLWML